MYFVVYFWQYNLYLFFSDQSRKVLEEVQMQKKLLKQGAAVSLNPIPPSAITSTPPVTANASHANDCKTCN
jgi:hypothetical protein